MVSTKCCAVIIIGVLVAVGVAVGIYFATGRFKKSSLAFQCTIIVGKINHFNK